MSHYFINDQSVKSRERELKYSINGIELTFVSDNGVFSKNEIDEGTSFLLKTLAPLNLGDNILDLGAGVGPIGITLAKINPTAFVTLAEINERALNLSIVNCTRNNVSARVKCLLSDAYSNVEGQFSSIVTNPPIRAGKEVTYRMYREAGQYLIDGGSLYIVIRRAQGAESAISYLKTLFKEVEVLDRHKGFYIVRAIKDGHTDK